MEHTCRCSGDASPPVKQLTILTSIQDMTMSEWANSFNQQLGG